MTYIGHGNEQGVIYLLGNEYPTLHFLEISDALSHCLYDFDRVSLEIPVKSCIVGMLLTYPILLVIKRTYLYSHSCNHICDRPRMQTPNAGLGYAENSYRSHTLAYLETI